MKNYRIRKKKDGKFSGGGMNPLFSSSGKIWTLGNLNRHLASIRSYYDFHSHFKTTYWPYNDCEIVEYETIEIKTIEIKKEKYA